MKIGLLGGSFDPIHNGHLHMAKSVYKTGDFDEIWLMPAGHSPNKNENDMTPANSRLRMCQIAAEELPFLKACSFEVDSKEKSYTYLTLETLTSQYPEHDFSFIMGADSLDYFDKWKNPDIIAKLCSIYVINRGEFSEEYLEEKITQINQLFPAQIKIVPCEKYHISSSEIRQKLGRNQDCSKYLPKKVLDYIQEKQLYII